MLLPAKTLGVGEAVFVTARSARVMTLFIAVSLLLLLFGSAVELAAVAVLVTPEFSAALELTLTTIVKTADSLTPTEAFEKTTLPVPPTAGLDVAQPLPVVTTAVTNVVLAGTASVTVTFAAPPGPAFDSVSV